MESSQNGEKTNEGFILEVTLKDEPIPGSVEVFEDVLPRPEQQYKIDGRNLQFPTTTNLPSETLTIKYYPRVVPHN